MRVPLDFLTGVAFVHRRKQHDNINVNDVRELRACDHL